MLAGTCRRSPDAADIDAVIAAADAGALSEQAVAGSLGPVPVGKKLLGRTLM